MPLSTLSLAIMAGDERAAIEEASRLAELHVKKQGGEMPSRDTIENAVLEAMAINRG